MQNIDIILLNIRCKNKTVEECMDDVTKTLPNKRIVTPVESDVRRITLEARYDEINFFLEDDGRIREIYVT